MRKSTVIPCDVLTQAFLVDENGTIIWKHCHFNLGLTGHPVATWTNDGYLYVQYRGAKMRAHRVVWMLVHGRWPRGDIDHINGDRADNRPINLRDVPRIENLRNARRRKDNTTGVTGVRRMRSRWQARIHSGGRFVYLGTFDKFDDAVAARKAAEREYGYHPNHGRAPITIGEGA